MITPRRTRLIRVSDLQHYRPTIVALIGELPNPQDAAVVVPTQASGVVLGQAIGARAHSLFDAPLVTRDQLYDELHRRLPNPPRRLSAFERDAIAQAAGHAAAGRAPDLPFKVRPGLVAELLRFYDQLRRQPQLVNRFEQLIADALGDGTDDRGAERLLRQTRFLADAFRDYERRVVESGACDEHTLRSTLIATPSAHPLRHVIVTVADWIADPDGLFVADFEMLAMLPDLQTIDLVCTAGVLGSGFHERLHAWWPGLEEIDGAAIVPPGTQRPRLAAPDPDSLWFTYRDREEELHGIAARLAGASTAWPRAAVVFKRPLPYLYLAPETLGDAGIEFRTFDTLPFAAEPAVAVVDLVLDALETSFARESMVALLSTPHLQALEAARPVERGSIAAMNRTMSSERYLGGIDRLERLAADYEAKPEGPAFRVALSWARELAALAAPGQASVQVDALARFLSSHAAPLESGDPLSGRSARARARLADVLLRLAEAHRLHHDPQWTFDDLASSVRRWISDQTIAPGIGGARGVALLDDQAARYGSFDDITIVGLIEHEWPERPRRNIFYPPTVLKALGWPSEKDRRSAEDARFLDLLASPQQRIALSTFTLDDETIVTRSVQLDEVPAARLSVVTEASLPSPVAPVADEHQGEWGALRASRASAAEGRFHGDVGPRQPQAWSVSALETYIGCPFRFYAQHILALEEEPEDEEIMDPRRQGQFVHSVFETFFREWQAAGRKAITADTLADARIMFVTVVDKALESIPEGEAALERTRLLGSSAASGLGEAVFRMEAERPVPVVERLLEHSLKGEFTLQTSQGPRVVRLRGKADRVDLLADGTFRVIDYKLGWPPDRGRALQLPIYSLCAEQRLAGYRGRSWTLSEAVYLAFKGPKRVVPLFSNAEARDETLIAAQQRLSDTIDAIERGQFPPSPDDVFRCEACSFSAVCRKDYVGDV